MYAFYKEERSVSFYADKMFLTPKHLSTLVKEVSGKTAGEWIDSLVILEAKAMLLSLIHIYMCIRDSVISLR